MLNRCLKGVLTLCLSIILASIITGCNTTDSEDLTLEIISPGNNSEFRINAVKVTGIVSNNDADVNMNGTQVCVEENGSFYEYLDILPGDNTIEIEAILGKEALSKRMNINFLPVLAMCLEKENLPTNVNQYSESPIEINGFVTIPLATVTVNGSPVLVTEDGIFSSMVLFTEENPTVIAVATFGEEEAVESYSIGSLTSPGLPGLLYTDRDYPLDKIDVKAGETKSADKVLQTGKLRKSDSYPVEYHYRLTGEVYYSPIYDEDQCEKITFPDEINISIEPDKFKGYAETTYHTTFIIRTDPELELGQYSIEFKNDGSTGHIILNVIK